MAVSLRALVEADFEAVRAIYAEGIETGNASFEREAPDWPRWDREHLAKCRLVAVDGGKIVGFAALSPVSGRCVYGGVAEVSVYVAAKVRGQGVGRVLLDGLVAASEEAGLWTLQAGIFPENEASIVLHQTCGFRVVGTRARLGLLAGEWRDVMLMERRSDRVGV